MTRTEARAPLVNNADSARRLARRRTYARLNCLRCMSGTRVLDTHIIVALMSRLNRSAARAMEDGEGEDPLRWTRDPGHSERNGPRQYRIDRRFSLVTGFHSPRLSSRFLPSDAACLDRSEAIASRGCSKIEQQKQLASTPVKKQARSVRYVECPPPTTTSVAASFCTAEPSLFPPNLARHSQGF